MSELVKTGDELFQKMTISMGRDKFLILPDGLDKLEDMLKEELSGFLGMTVSKEASSKFVSSVFARFKKENEI